LPRLTPYGLRFCLLQKHRGIARKQRRQLLVDRRSLHELQCRRIVERSGLLYRASLASALPLTKHSERQRGPPLYLSSHPVLSRDGRRTLVVSDGRKHTAEEEQITGLYGFDIGAERSGRRREFDAELLQSALRVGRLRALAAYHFPECAPPSTCSTSPVT
jgi:hypothetical protein